MIRLHYGPPNHPGALRFFQGTLSSKTWKQRAYFEHPIKWWLGLSWGSAWFVGIVRTDGTRDEQVKVWSS